MRIALSTAAWAADWLTSILTREGVPITPEVKEHLWTALTSLASAPAGEVKRVMRGVPTTEAVAAFARLWASDEHWAAADKVMKKGK